MYIDTGFIANVEKWTDVGCINFRLVQLFMAEWNVLLHVISHQRVSEIIRHLDSTWAMLLEPLSQLEVSSGDIELTRCNSTVKAICVGLASSANYPDQ